MKQMSIGIQYCSLITYKRSHHSHVVTNPEYTQHWPYFTVSFVFQNFSRISVLPVHVEGLTPPGKELDQRPDKTPPSLQFELAWEELNKVSSYKSGHSLGVQFLSLFGYCYRKRKEGQILELMGYMTWAADEPIGIFLHNWRKLIIIFCLCYVIRALFM